MAKKYVEGKFKKIKLLMSFLTLIRGLDEVFNCSADFGFNSRDLTNKIYEKISNLAING